ncbi:MAG: thiamine-phosphate kinase, partial [Desulfobulbaceae bacterium]|nr:thiamine-phosphate kinase [Desulfobulbaceae bacterium]
MAGFLESLAAAQVMLIGGDTVQSNGPLSLSVTVGGEVAEGLVLYRSGAQPGDLIWVSGPLGEAAAGLALCREGRGADDPAWRQLVAAHLDPEPELALGPLLAASGHVHAMMDLSDGLATDLAHLCAASGVGAEVVAEQLPLSQPLRAAAVRLQHAALDWALRGGEDYRLLFTAPAGATLALESLTAERLGRGICCVGRIVEGSGVVLCDGSRRQDISFQGYDHFAS